MLTKILTGIAIFLAFVLFIDLVTMIEHLGSMLKQKSVYFNVQAQVQAHSTELKFSERVELTNNILNLIDSMIADAITITFANYAALKLKYEIINLDNDVKIISSSVYSGLLSETFSKDNIVLTDEYVLKYITQHVKTSLLTSVKTYNDNITGRSN